MSRCWLHEQKSCYHQHKISIVRLGLGRRRRWLLLYSLTFYYQVRVPFMDIAYTNLYSFLPAVFHQASSPFSSGRIIIVSLYSLGVVVFMYFRDGRADGPSLFFSDEAERASYCCACWVADAMRRGVGSWGRSRFLFQSVTTRWQPSSPSSSSSSSLLLGSCPYTFLFFFSATTGRSHPAPAENIMRHRAARHVLAVSSCI